MKTGDTVRDGSGRSYQVGQLLGRGLWGKTYSCREEPGGSEWILKIPHGPEAFSEDGDRLARVCREIALEQGRLLGGASVDGLIRPEARFTTDTGIPVLVLPRLPASLRARMAPGMPLESLLVAVADVAGMLRGLSADLGVHGNLRPENILATGSGGWVLSDPATPSLLRDLPALARARSQPLTWLPPEARTGHDGPLTDPSVDTHALAAALLVGALTPHDGQPPAMPDDGLDKATLVALKDVVRNRLRDENTNDRFHARLSDRLATLLNRALSRETSPSPPYRFNRADELQARVAEVAAMARPHITHVGRLLLDRPPGSDAFTTEEDVVFSCSVGCSAGVENHEDIGTGLAVFDLADESRLRDVPCSYTVDRHPSGRYRFGFHVAGLKPGHYRLRVAFTIRDSGEQPQTSEGELTVHPAAGYVPPPSEPAPKAIAFDRKEATTAVTEVAPGPQADQAPVTPTLPPAPGPSPTAAAAAAPPASTAATAAPPAPDQPARQPSAAASAMPGPSTRSPRPVAPSKTDSGLAHTGVTAVPLSGGRSARPTDPPEPELAEPKYKGAGRWTDLPLPGPGLGGPPPGDPFADELTEPLDPDANQSAFDRLLALTEGDAYKLFIGGFVVVILLLVIALAVLN